MNAPTVSSRAMATMMRMLMTAEGERCRTMSRAVGRPRMGGQSRRRERRRRVSKRRGSCPGFDLTGVGGLDAIFFHSPVERAAAEAEGVGGLGHGSGGTREGLA